MNDEFRDASLSLSEWASGVTSADIPDDVRHIVRTCVVDTIGVAVAGSRTGVAATARQFAEENACRGSADVLGSATASSAAAAAFCNAAAAHALDFDDNCYAGFVHGSAVIVPAAIALAQTIDAKGADLITAITVGAECEYAVGAAAGMALYQKGWWTTGLLGPIGAGVAVGHLLKLEAAQMRSCIGLAVAGAGGTKICFGTDGKALLAAQASEAGLRWACLAAAGATGPSDPFSHPAGFAALHNDGAFDHAACQDLGRVWRLQTPGVDIKKYPVCLSSHAAVDIIAELIAQEEFSHDDIDEVLCDVPPVVVANLKYSSPGSHREAQFSMEFAVAGTLCFGALGLDQLHEEVIESDTVQAIMQRVRMVSGTMWDADRCEAAPEGASVLISLKDGRRYSGYRTHARGTAANPMPAADIQSKFLSCSEPALGRKAALSLLHSLECLDADVSVRSLLNPAH
ncbi:MmgE/PrpD family protein [Aurantimonas sp. A3-2-R12]|uniref:MmgE/PrpD family protein n=1 Tax=Aurantimonas sp. A3-2-R12 TaxID=3114362 RepID=UPI002E16FE1D|nr:MmgE/PrpD family protein [Aurantimonas sp. A3-2-R12]